MARSCNLKTADKEESMEICFVPDNDYGAFLQQAGLATKHRGEIVNLQGHVLGHHDGVEFYTETKIVVERWPKEWSRTF